jgi:uncharacterized protein (DUF488 family)
MYYRRKILLALLQTFGGVLPKIDFQKYLFLLNVNNQNPFFEFIPYKYGCFSFQANQDMSTMVKYSLVTESEKNWQLKSVVNYFNDLKEEDGKRIKELQTSFGNLKGRNLIKYVYENYPYYSINSTIKENILDTEYLKAVENSRPSKSEFTLFSIGYEGKTVEHFTNELIAEDIKVLCDVRKNALSMKYGFSKKQLKNVVENAGIKYIHIPALGIESDKRQQLNTKEDYDNLFRNYEINTIPQRDAEISELYKMFIEHKRIALMCFEADHNFCHRSRTIEALEKKFEKEFLIKHL